ncbi:hypothetical protein IFU30_03295 [Plantibacter sp. CFBP 8798]|nr:hypothetical protein [Plantibacter sp. CFBP 8798]MBD8465285.1 hypothetical protein [Plantibacter sp. CFBP 8798]
MTTARIVSVSSDDEHRFSKPRRDAITLVAGLGIVVELPDGVGEPLAPV